MFCSLLAAVLRASAPKPCQPLPHALVPTRPASIGISGKPARFEPEADRLCGSWRYHSDHPEVTIFKVVHGAMVFNLVQFEPVPNRRAPECASGGATLRATANFLNQEMNLRGYSSGRRALQIINIGRSRLIYFGHVGRSGT